MLHRALTLCLLLTAAVVSAPAAQAEESFDVKDYLRRSGTRLLVVEFYATWCKPCMAAVPRWKKLHDKYRADGLRLVVVNTQDADNVGRCTNPGWNPDMSLCDLEGHIARKFKIGGKLPAAFLWSWQGNLLVQAGHVDEVEAAVKRYLKRMPRVAIEAPEQSDAAVTAMLREKLTDSGKMLVVAGESERKLLAEVRRRSRTVDAKSGSGCRLGQELKANSVLKYTFAGSAKKRYLALTLLDAEKGCAVGAATVPWHADKARVIVAEAVDKLLSKLRGPLQWPGARKASSATKMVFRGGGDFKVDQSREVVVNFNSTPRGDVYVNGVKLCKASAASCSRELQRGPQVVEIRAKDYVPMRRTLEVTDGTNVNWTLEPDFGLLSVQTQPPGLTLTLDGQALPAPPFKDVRIKPGAHMLALSSACHAPGKQTFTIGRGESKRFNFSPPARVAGLEVKAVDGAGSPQRAEVFLDGKRVGLTPYRAKLDLCTKEVELRHGTLGRWRRRLGPSTAGGALKERQLTKLRATFYATTLNVVSDVEGVGLSVDGRFVGFAPKTLQVPPGRHRVSVRDKCFRAVREVVIDAKQGQAQRVDVRAVQVSASCVRTGRLTLAGLVPGDEVFVDGLRVRPGAGGQVELSARKRHAVVVARAQPGHLPWSGEVTLKPGQSAVAQVRWRRLLVVGARGGDRFGWGRWRASATRADGGLSLSVGDALGHVVWRRGAEVEVRLPLTAQRRSQGRVRLPGILRVRSQFPRTDVELTGVAGGPLKRRPTVGQQLTFTAPAGAPAQLVAVSHSYATYKRTLTLRPGQEVSVELNERLMPRDPRWAQWDRNRSLRRWGWRGLLGAGGVAVTAGILGAVSAGYGSSADDAYGAYRVATSTAAANSAFSDAQSAESSAATWRNAALGTAALSATLTAIATYLLVSNPDEPPPGR